MPPLHPMSDGLGGPDATPSSPARGALQHRPSALSRRPSPAPTSPLWGWWVGRISGQRSRSLASPSCNDVARARAGAAQSRSYLLLLI
eukprot:4967649-Pleurochrysis_carterae.AAC.1